MNSDSFDLIIKNVNIATMNEMGQPYGVVHGGCIGIVNDEITFVGKETELTGSAQKIHDGQGKWLLPGFIDCHTHAVFAGDRANEFEMRLNGMTYKQISEQGGGIKSTVLATRKASFDSLLSSAIPRVKRLIEEGVTTIEIKSGYGLSKSSEEKMLRVAKAISEHLPVSITTTFLGAHAIPTEFTHDPDGYIDYLCNECIPFVAKNELAESVDVFCESIGFSPDQCEKVFKVAKEHGLKIRAHVEQLSNLKGAKLAASMGATSVDHIEYLCPEDIPTLKQNNTTAVLLPGAFYYLNETRKPPVDALRKHGVSMAVASDLNPGSSPISSLLTCANMACVFFNLTPEEALRGITINAAKALGIDNIGMLKKGFRADLCLWDIQHPAQLVYSINQYRPIAKWVGGKRV